MKLEIPDVAEELSVPSAIKRPSFGKLDLKVLLAIALACATLITYYPVRHNDFIALDDPDYVTENADVQQGFKLKTVAWAFSTFFFLLTIWSYVTYVRLPSFRNYMVTMITFALGLMAKPMLVTLPFIMLLLDCWPLRRVAQSGVSAISSEIKDPSLIGLLRE